MGLETLIIIAVLILSIVLHEVAHGYAADWLGDPTARMAGRLSLNPIVHIDPVGSVLIPALLLISPGGFLFGWAKPVPYNPHNLRAPKWGEAIVAAAGPAVNLLLALVFALLVRFADPLGLSYAFTELAVAIIVINLFLALLNLVPIPPLDGSTILSSVLPPQARLQYQRLTELIHRTFPFSLILLLLLFVLFIGQFIFVGVISIGVLLSGLDVGTFLGFLSGSL